jgi:hypothetical protein
MYKIAGWSSGLKVETSGSNLGLELGFYVMNNYPHEPSSIILYYYQYNLYMYDLRKLICYLVSKTQVLKRL